MKILIIGLGYAGQRYHRSFVNLGKELGIPMLFSYVGRRKRSEELPYFDTVSEAIKKFCPDIVVVSVNDHSHILILKELSSFKGFVICEKPLAVPGEDWSDLNKSLKNIKGFALNLVERYSETTQTLRNEVKKQQWTLIRATFYWGKDRINDYRPTCGVTSEIIHALDLIYWICEEDMPLKLEAALGIKSDFSISGEYILDTVLITAKLGDSPIAGYSSFVNIKRQRNVDFTFINQSGKLYHSRIVYDTPEWDSDHLKIWTRDINGKNITVLDLKTEPRKPGLETIEKLSLFCKDVILYVSTNAPPIRPFADLNATFNLQRLLDEISQKVLAPLPARYIRGQARALLPHNADLESLG
ncbi:Gfo/Idh/MocA family oxidoreductase [Brenneria goodwinii]|uniref:Gfo/Idh/MocA family oxidoreductase n=1 Tax=Brenneria goodwinii TaxID=1109412 RepID=UPI001EFA3CA5|nr:Gfo/Idh/MocA family oxidoreductase [Brenneria bubanii]